MKPRTASLENSKALVERGVRLETAFCHVNTLYTTTKEFFYRIHYGPHSQGIPAPTFEEIVEVLPEPRGHQWFCTCKIQGGKYVCTVPENIIGPSKEEFPIKIADTPSDCACLMLLWLIDNGHLSVDEINKEKDYMCHVCGENCLGTCTGG